MRPEKESFLIIHADVDDDLFVLISVFVLVLISMFVLLLGMLLYAEQCR